MAAVSIMNTYVLADDVAGNVELETEGNIIVVKDAEIGTVYDLGNGIKAKVIGNETYDSVIDNAIEPFAVRPTVSNWSLTLSGTSKSKTWTTSSTYPYWHAELDNTQSTINYTTVKITSPKTYSTITTTSYVYGGNRLAFYMDSQDEYEDHIGTYTMSITSQTVMSGTASGFLTDYLPDAYNG